jgi:RNA polymerase sigma-70 factor, ECF subfamily
MNLETDRAVLEAYRRGERSTLDALYRHFSAPVLRYLARGFRVKLSGGVGQAQVSPLDLDAAHQETFVRAFGESARLHYDGLKPFEPYLFAIARSAAVDVLRAQGKLNREAVPLDDLTSTEAPVDPRESPEQLALRAEAEALVKAFLATLSAEDLRFATARFIEGLSQEKAGQACGLSRQEARTREAKLKAACLEHLGQRGFLETGAATSARALVAMLAFTMLFP